MHLSVIVSLISGLGKKKNKDDFILLFVGKFAIFSGVCEGFIET